MGLQVSREDWPRHGTMVLGYGAWAISLPPWRAGMGVGVPAFPGAHAAGLLPVAPWRGCIGSRFGLPSYGGKDLARLGGISGSTLTAQWRCFTMCS